LLPAFLTPDFRKRLLNKSSDPDINTRALFLACITETSDIADPVRDGGDANLVFGFAEYADGEADRTFSVYPFDCFAVAPRERAPDA
jgi:hypothetical protein